MLPAFLPSKNHQGSPEASLNAFVQRFCKEATSASHFCKEATSARSKVPSLREARSPQSPTKLPKVFQKTPKSSTEFRKDPYNKDSSAEVNFRRQSLSGLNTSLYRILIIFPFPFEFFVRG
jgi:hypothetical protein